MMEKRLAAISPQLFTSSGSNVGVVTVFNATIFRVKQEVLINASTLPTLELEVKRVISPTQLIVGPRGSSIDSILDISAYTTGLGANISAKMQKRPSIPMEEFLRAVYEEEPVVALRGIPVDELGNIRNDDNPAPIQANTWWDEANITRDGDDDILKVEFEKNDTLVETIDLEYNGEKSVVKVIKS